MALLQYFNDIYNMKYFDFENPNTDLYTFHPQVRLLFAINGIFFNNPDSYLRFIWPALIVSLSLVATSLEGVFVYFGLLVLQDYSFATECFCYFVCLGVIPIVQTSILLNKENIYLLLDKMNKDFLEICRMDTWFRKPFLQGQLLIWKLCVIWFSFCGFVIFIFVLSMLSALLWQSLFATQDEHMVRPLMFPLWLPKDDPYRSPNYEIFLIIQVIMCFIMLQTFCVYIYSLFHILLHSYYILNMIILAFKIIFNGLQESDANLPKDDPRRKLTQDILNARIKRIVEWHKSVFVYVSSVSSMYGPQLVYQVMFSATAICLMAYQIADNFDRGVIDVLFIALCIGGTMQLWIPCYIGSIIRNKGFEVGDECFYCGWHETSLGKLIRQDILLFIHRTQQPVCIKFIGLPEIQLETFSSIMSSAYSYFNMLRQYSAK